MALCVATFRCALSQWQLPHDQEENSVFALSGAQHSVGRPARKGWKENYATVTASFVWNGVTENLAVLPHYSRLVGVILFFEGWIIQLSTQYYFQIAFYNENTKYSVLSPIFSSIFEVNFLRAS